jgi:hypothetical protein
MGDDPHRPHSDDWRKTGKDPPSRNGLPWTYDLDPERMALPDRETGTLHPGNPED